MRVLIAGNGKAGSWRIRGEQLGAAIGATVKAEPTAADIAAHDIVVVVKRLPMWLVLAVRAARKLLVWDIVDAWPQPQGNAWTRDGARMWLRNEIQQLEPDGLVFATKEQARDAGEHGHPSIVLHHHARTGLERNPIRDRVKVIGYEGRPVYIEPLADMIGKECSRRGCDFVLNPRELADVDIVLALRGGQWDGYAPRAWKSNVKLANAQASGTPFVGAHEAGYLETSSGGEYWASNPAQLTMALDWLSEPSNRRGAAERLLAAAPRVSLDAIAARYREWLATLL